MGRVVKITVLLCIMTGLVFSANSEALVYKSPFVWRTDDAGDYALSYDLSMSKGLYEGKEVLYTEGDVTGITVSWKAIGKVTIEVSANNGLNYTPVYNGVPLIKGFITGRAIKWKAFIGEDSNLTEVKIIYSDTSGVAGSFGEPAISEFKYRKKIQIVNGLKDVSLFNYQIKLNIAESSLSEGIDLHCEGNILADFRDVRFTAADGQTLLPYYIEKITGTKPNQQAEIFVKIPQIPQEGVSVYIYYGNPDAADYSNGEETFDFYDDFSGEVVDEEKWDSNRGSQGNISVVNSNLFIEDARITSKSFQFKEGIIEYAAAANTGVETAVIIRDQNVGLEEEIDQVAYSSAYPDAQHCIALNNIVYVNDPNPIVENTEYDYRIIAEGKTITFQRYAKGFSEKEAEVSYQDLSGPEKGYIGLKSKSMGGDKNIAMYKYIRVRANALICPRVLTNGSLQEVVNTAVFNNMTIRENGNLSLLDNGIAGNYTSPHTRSPFNIRILTPYYAGKQLDDNDIRFDVSTDNGKTFHKDCVNAASYYVSKGDIALDNKLLHRILFNSAKGKNKIGEIESVTLVYSPGYLSVISPNGAEILTAGTKAEILWSAFEYDVQYPIKLEYSVDMGKTYKVISAGAKNTGSLIWSVPAEISNNALIKVSDAKDLAVFDISDKFFTIERKKGMAGKISSKENGSQENDEAAETGVTAAKEIDLNGFTPLDRKHLTEFTESVMRSDTQVYDILVKVNDRDSITNTVDYAYGQIVNVKPAGHQWSSLERRKFLVIQMYLTYDQAIQIASPREIEVEINDGVREVKKQGINKINLEKIGVIGLDLSAIRELLKDKVLSTVLIEEQIVE